MDSDHKAYDVWKIREDFPMLKKKMNGKHLIYLDSAATAQKPQSVIDAMTRFYTKEYATVHRAVYELAAHSTEMYAMTRTKVQQFLNAKSEKEIIFTKGTTESINLVAHSFGKAFINKGDNVIISEMEHHSNIVPWQMVCEEREAVLQVIPINDKGELILEAFEKMLSKKTKIVSIAHVANTTGTINPVKDIIEKAHTMGAKVMIDGAQSAPSMPVDVQDLNADFYAFSGHKLYGPTGIGVLYGKKDLLEQMPPYQGGGDMIEDVTFEKTTYQPLPLKFEAGTPLIGGVVGLGAAIDYLEKIGREKIAQWKQGLLHHATEHLQTVKGLKVLGTSSQKSGIITFSIEGSHPLDLGTLLGLKGIAIRTGNLCAGPALKRFNTPVAARLSFGLYNTFEEVDMFVQALKECIDLLKPEMSY